LAGISTTLPVYFNAGAVASSTHAAGSGSSFGGIPFVFDQRCTQEKLTAADVFLRQLLSLVGQSPL
jgi:hypothetical protein